MIARMDGMSQEERRALAIQKLSKAFGGRGGRRAYERDEGSAEEEKEALEAIIRSKDVAEIHKIAKERLEDLEEDGGGNALARRFKKLRDEYDQEEAGRVASKRMEEALRQLHMGSYDSAITQDCYWDRSFSHGLAVAGQQAASGRAVVGGDELARHAQLLKDKGFMVMPGIDWGPGVSLPRLVGAMQEIKAGGWPACFVFAYQEPWTLLERIFDVVSPIFGSNDIAIEPSVFAWHLDPPRGDPSLAGNNGFHLPHRDFSFTETFAPDGSLSALSVWMPLTDARVDNGCMYVLPKEFDREHDKPESETHLRAAVQGKNGGTDIKFSLQGVRPLEGPAGSLMAWHGNTVHWGGRCASDAPFPRASMACTFCRRSAMSSLDGNSLVTRSDITNLDLKKRLGMVAHSIIMHKRWYSIREDMVPPVFFQNSGM